MPAYSPLITAGSTFADFTDFTGNNGGFCGSIGEKFGQ